MPFISAADGLIKKSTTSVENKFISKYLPELDPAAAKVYLYSLYLLQSGSAFTAEDMAQSLSMSVEEIVNCYTYLEELELVSVLSVSPLEVKILEAENVRGKPKKIKPEKYADFTKSVQSILSGRMISTNEFLEYFLFLEEYGFEQEALIMTINHCVNLRGNDIRFAYIKKVIMSFYEENAVTARKVEEKLSNFTASTPSLLVIFKALGMRKQPDFDDDKLYRKWTEELGFDDGAIVCAAKQFKLKTCEKLDSTLEELFKNRKFDVKEIEDYCKNKSSVYALTLDIAKELGVYMQNSAPYVENYVSPWCNYGFSFECLKDIANYSFRRGKKSFEETDAFIKKLYDRGIIADKSVAEYIKEREAEDALLKKLLDACGLTRKIVPWDRESLAKWRSWNFSDEMLFEAAKISSGKSNPLAYMNGVLSAWKSDGAYSKDRIATPAVHDSRQQASDKRAEIERHYFDLRHSAEAKAEAALSRATADSVYGEIRKKLSELSIKLAFAEIRDKAQAAEISKNINALEAAGAKRLSELCIDSDDFIPRYSCEICKDTGYEQNGLPCVCLKKFLSGLN